VADPPPAFASGANWMVRVLHDRSIV